MFARADGSADQTFVTRSYTVSELLAADVAAVVHAGADNYGNIPVIYRYDADNNGPSIGDPIRARSGNHREDRRRRCPQSVWTGESDRRVY